MGGSSDGVVNGVAEDQLSHDVSRLAVVAGQDVGVELDSGRVVLLEVRPDTEYATGHIPTARNIAPDHMHDELARLLPHLADAAPDTKVVAYCRGPYCAYAPQALRALDALGIGGKLLPGAFVTGIDSATLWRKALFRPDRHPDATRCTQDCDRPDRSAAGACASCSTPHW